MPSSSSKLSLKKRDQKQNKKQAQNQAKNNRRNSSDNTVPHKNSKKISIGKKRKMEQNDRSLKDVNFTDIKIVDPEAEAEEKTQVSQESTEITKLITNPLFDHDADFLSFADVKPLAVKSTEKQMHSKYDREENYPWISDETLEIDDINCYLHNEILDYVKWIEPSDEDKDERHNLVKRLKKIVQKTHPEAVVMVFGSCATNLNLPNSDIDLLVYNPDVRELNMLNKISDSLVKSGICKSIEALKFTKVPLIKLQDKKTNINVDISFNRTNGIYCVKLVKFLQKKYPELRPLILILKAFLKSRQLNETYSGGVGSFLLTMMVTSYLQREYKKGGTDIIDLGRHLINFFELYGQTFNYEDVGISIRKQGTYFSKEDRGWTGHTDAQRFRLSVENPQDPEVDIGRASYAIKKVQRAFQHAYDTLIYNNMGSTSLLKLIITASPKDM